MKLGTGSAVISPRVWDKITMSGMGRRIPTRGVLEDLRAQVFILQEKSETVVVSTIDQLFISEEMADSIGDRVRKRLPEAKLILCATHVHSAEAIPFDRNDPVAKQNCAAAREIVYEGYSAAFEQALGNLREVEVASDRIHVPVPLGLNRRGRLDNGSCITAWDNGAMIPPGHKLAGKSSEDATWIDVLAFREPGQSRPRALISSYPSHVHFYEIPYFTDEAAGAARRALKKLRPEAEMVYALGCCGNIALGFAHPIPGNDEETRIAWYKEKSNAFGETFARVLDEQLDKLEYRPVDSLAYTSYREPGTERLQDMLIETLRIGSHAITVMPGEMFIEFDGQLRAGQPAESLLVMTYNRSFLGYVATPLGFEEGSYETMRGPVTQVGYLTPTERVKSELTTGDFIVGKAREQLATLFAR